MRQSPVLVEFKMLLSQKVSLLQNVERREKTFPLKYFFIWKQQPTDLLLAHLPADTPHSAKGDRPKPESSTDSKENAVFARLEPEPGQVNPEASL